MSCPVFKPGEVVVCQFAGGYLFTLGKEYKILEYDPPDNCPLPNFSFPAYVAVLDDFGRRAECHARRFRKRQEVT